MMDLSECLTDHTRVFVTTDVKPRKNIFRKEKERTLFFKDFNHAEFIGEELCDIKDIRCSHYFIAGLGLYNLNREAYYRDVKNQNLSYKIGSYNFKSPGFSYKTIHDYDMNLGDTPFDSMLNQTPNEKNQKQLCMDLLNLLALDIYMGQVDRYYYNYLFEEDCDHNIRLAPIFDFEYSLKDSFLNKRLVYESDLYTFHTIDECKEFIHRYPMFRDILASYLDVDLIGAIYRSYNRRGLRIPNEKWKFYREFEDGRKNTIQKIL